MRVFNTRIQSFPNNLIARTLRFSEAEFFEVQQATERQSPTVEID
ncbi:MAG: LemA family protein [Gammaproteobacteria bacterium]|nr:LemA family protein [Gammaproteobacteria bacterium]